MPKPEKSMLTHGFSRIIDFLSHYFTLSAWFIRDDKDVFYRVERILMWITFFCFVLLLTLHYLPKWLALMLCILLVQRVVEFFAVYAKNFIFNKGRVFTHFEDPIHRGRWLLLTFVLNVFQLSLVFAIWYRYLDLFTLSEPFSQPMTILNSFYFSLITFLTVGYGDIIPYTTWAKLLVVFQTILTFYVFVIVVNGLISIHFVKRD